MNETERDRDRDVDLESFDLGSVGGSAATALKRKPLLANRLRQAAYKYQTTLAHMIGVCVAVALPKISVLTSEDFHEQFGQHGRFKERAEISNERRTRKIEKHVRLARKREARILGETKR